MKMKGNRGTGTSAKYLRSDIGVWVVRVFMCIYSVIVLYPCLLYTSQLGQSSSPACVVNAVKAGVRAKQGEHF